MPANSGEWISVRHAMAISGATRPTIERYMREGRVSVRQLPDTLPRLRRSDLEQIINASIRPASAVGA